MGGLLHDRFDSKFKAKLKNLKFRRLKTWQLLVCLVPLFGIVAVFLRVDHLRMNEIIDEVAAADESGDQEAINTSLTKLRDFTFSHVIVNVIEDNGNQSITLGTGPVYLKKQYMRAAEAAIAEAEKTENLDSNPYGNIYQKASDVCKQKARQNGWYNYRGAEYIGCMTSEIEKYPAAAEINDTIMAKIPSADLYKKEYASPFLAPCLSGIFIIITIIIISIIIFRLLVWLFFKLAILFL